MRFVENLIRSQVVSREEADKACATVGRKEKAVLSSLLNSGAIKPEQLLQERAEFYRMPLVDVDAIDKDPAVVHLISFEMAKRRQMLPVKLADGVLTVAVADPLDIVGMDDLRAVTSHTIERVLCCPERLREAINKNFKLDGELKGAVDDLASDDWASGDSLLSPQMAHLTSEFSNSPVAKTVQHILENAAQLGASDIHLEPRETSVDLRYRIDGELTTIQTLPLRHLAAIVARIKIISQMDISEQRRPQDGRAHLSFRGRKTDLRVSTLPMIFGEKVVIRLLSQGALANDALEGLCMEAEAFKVYSRAITAKQGMVLITGPTGSGKTTTLYSTLAAIRTGKSNITTIEDPIEYRLDGINQSQVNAKIGVTFAGVLRTILRQDPDVILVGEIRDRETADIAFRSSLTGHLVFSTLHTNDAIGAVTRLYDIGLESYLVASALLCVVAQRLVRAVCADCREMYRPDEAVLEPFLKFFPEKGSRNFYRGRGCPKCSGTGFRGRRPIFEVLPIDDEMRAAISMRVGEDVLYSKARRAGFRSLGDAALEMALQGVTTLEEALPFFPTNEIKNDDVMKALAEFVDRHRPESLLVVRNNELARRIIANVPPDDYCLIQPRPVSVEPLQINDVKSSIVFPSGLPELLGVDEEGGERRQYSRITRDFILQYRIADSIGSDWQTTVVRDLASGGCSFRVDQSHGVGNALELRLQLPAEPTPMNIKSIIRHRTDHASGAGQGFLGVSFEALTVEHEKRLGRAIQFFLKRKKTAVEI